jgi:hypothetical protein
LSILGFFQRHPEADAFIIEKWNSEGWNTNRIAAALQEQYGEPVTKNSVIGRKNRIKAKEGGPMVNHYTANRQRQEGLAAARKQQLEIKLLAKDGGRPRIPGKRQEGVPMDVVPTVVGKTRFLNVRPGQCKLFLPGNEGMNGFVCGEATGAADKSWCPACLKRVFVPGTAYKGQRQYGGTRRAA